MHFGCGSSMFGANPVALCAPLARLKEEHVPLRAQMDDYYAFAQTIGKDESVADYSDKLRELLTKVNEFVAELDPHSLREEDALFPMMAKYIGRETGPIAVMEYEHDQAKQQLKHFRETMETLGAPVGAEQAKTIAAYAINAYLILTEHFMKEENVLFPMAEQMLSEAEKEELGKKFEEIA